MPFIIEKNYLKKKERYPGLPTGFYCSHPLDRKQTFFLRVARRLSSFVPSNPLLTSDSNFISLAREENYQIFFILEGISLIFGWMGKQKFDF